MAVLTPSQRRKDDQRIVPDAETARRWFCTGGAMGWPKFQRLVRITKEPICVRCHRPIDMTLTGSDPYGPTVDHLSTQVSDVVGWTKGDARRALHDINTVGLAHRLCNQHAGHGINARTTGTHTSTGRQPLPTVRLVHHGGFRLPNGDVIGTLPAVTHGWDERCEVCADR